jgi:hypothetical protein
LLDYCNFGEVFEKIHQYYFSKIWACHFSSFKAYCNLYFVSCFKEFASGPLLNCDVVLSYFKAHSDLFDFNIALLFAVFCSLLVLFVEVFTPVEEFADRRFRAGRDLC